MFYLCPVLKNHSCVLSKEYTLYIIYVSHITTSVPKSQLCWVPTLVENAGIWAVRTKHFLIFIDLTKNVLESTMSKGVPLWSFFFTYLTQPAEMGYNLDQSIIDYLGADNSLFIFNRMFSFAH
jgi:hypothetical protein